MTLDRNIRTAIKTLILEVDATAEVYAYNTLSHKPEEWANLFRKKVGNIKKVNGWVIRRNAATDSYDGKSRGNIQTYSYDVWGFYGFRDTSDNDNSDNEFQAIIDALRDKFRSEPKLRIDCAGDDCIDEHLLLSFPVITTLGGGSEQMHFAEGSLRVQLCEQLY